MTAFAPQPPRIESDAREPGRLLLRGHWTLEHAGTLTIEPLALTKRGCEGDAATVETTMVSVLRGGVQAQIQGRSLNLIGPDGILMFVTP